MKRLVTVTGPVTAAQMDGYHIEEWLLDHIMIQVSDKRDGSLEDAFDERDRRYLSQFPAAQLADGGRKRCSTSKRHVRWRHAMEKPPGSLMRRHRELDRPPRLCNRRGRNTIFRLAWSS
jgi:hypothetical protein